MGLHARILQCRAARISVARGCCMPGWSMQKQSSLSYVRGGYEDRLDSLRCSCCCRSCPCACCCRPCSYSCCRQQHLMPYVGRRWPVHQQPRLHAHFVRFELQLRYCGSHYPRQGGQYLRPKECCLRHDEEQLLRL